MIYEIAAVVILGLGLMEMCGYTIVKRKRE